MNKLGVPDNALLAAKLAPRLELVALQQGQVATDAAAGPVVQISPVVNDVRLPSHLALERQLPAGVSAAPAQGEAAAAAPGADRLSAAARLIGALLAQLPDAGPVRAALPIWSAAQRPPASPALAGALAQAVDRSGLFYESHLVQFAAGARTLAQMAQEPQARWASSLPVRSDASAAHADAPPAGELIHPQAATVVHQQLDLLASAVFRWSGQAWPEVPMDWSIREEGARRDDAAPEPAPRRWSTTLSLELPRLGAVELRLSLAGTEVQARFSASEAAAALRMRSQAPALEQRFEAAGLRLQGLQVDERGSEAMSLRPVAPKGARTRAEGEGTSP